jgi:hypothetical protein
LWSAKIHERQALHHKQGLVLRVVSFGDKQLASLTRLIRPSYRSPFASRSPAHAKTSRSVDGHGRRRTDPAVKKTCSTVAGHAGGGRFPLE